MNNVFQTKVVSFLDRKGVLGELGGMVDKVEAWKGKFPVTTLGFLPELVAGLFLKTPTEEEMDMRLSRILQVIQGAIPMEEHEEFFRTMIIFLKGDVPFLVLDEEFLSWMEQRRKIEKENTFFYFHPIVPKGLSQTVAAMSGFSSSFISYVLRVVREAGTDEEVWQKLPGAITLLREAGFYKNQIVSLLGTLAQKVGTDMSACIAMLPHAFPKYLAESETFDFRDEGRVSVLIGNLVEDLAGYIDGLG